jgi:hypothetical protein
MALKKTKGNSFRLRFRWNWYKHEGMGIYSKRIVTYVDVIKCDGEGCRSQIQEDEFASARVVASVCKWIEAEDKWFCSPSCAEKQKAKG